MRTKIDCCWDCPDRQADPNCHGYCERYLRQKAEYEETKAAKDQKAQVESGLSGQMLTMINKASHHRNLHSKHKKWR